MIKEIKDESNTIVFGTTSSGKTKVLFNKAIELVSNGNDVIFITFEENKHTLYRRFGIYPNINIIKCDYLTIDDLNDILYEHGANYLFIDNLSHMNVRNGSYNKLLNELKIFAKEYNIEIFVSLNVNKRQINEKNCFIIDR